MSEDQSTDPKPAESATTPAAAETTPVDTVPTTPVAIGAPTPAPATSPAKPKSKGGGYYWGTGRRKTAVARVRMRPGSGKFLIQDREINHYFSEPSDRNDVVAPLRATGTFGKFDIFIKVTGGGRTGQAQAILLGVARALLKIDSNHLIALRDGRFLTRDSREVERKKPGQPGARKRFQFSKR